MASYNFSSNTQGSVNVGFVVNGRSYSNQRLSILPDLCVDVILGLDFQSQHQTMTFNLAGDKPPIEICGLTALNVSPPEIFGNLTPDC